MATELSVSTDRVRKFVDGLEAEKAILSTCTQLFTNLSNHFKSLEETLALRSNSVESKLQSLESASRRTLEALSNREGSIPQRESEAIDRVRQRKQAAISELEKPAAKDPALSDSMRALAVRMDSLGLVKFTIARRREPGPFRLELTDAINEAIDPPRLVLNAVEDFLENKATQTGIMDKRWAVGMLVHALFPDLKSDANANANAGDDNADSGPKFGKAVVERAWRILESWKMRMDTDSGSDFGRFGPVEAVMFLEMAVGFGLKSRLGEDFLKKMVVEFSSRRDIAKLAPCLGFGETLADIIDELVKKGKEIDAVYFATESGMTERFSPASLLKSFLKTSKKNAMDALKKNNGSPAASEESSNIELNAIKAVVKCVEDQKLQSVFTVDVLKKRATILEKMKSERKKSSGSGPSSSKPSGKRNYSSGTGKSGGGPPLRPAKVAKVSYQLSYSLRTPTLDQAQALRQPSPATRYSGPQYSTPQYSTPQYRYPSHDAYEVIGGTVYTTSSYLGQHGRNPTGISPTQYSPLLDVSATAASTGAAYHPSLPGEQTSYAAYRPSLPGEQTSYAAYDYTTAGQQAYQPTNPSYTQ